MIMRATFTVGRVLGIPIRVHLSWFVAVGLSTGLFALRVYPAIFPDATVTTCWLLALATALIFFLSILLHELGHALVARRCGVPVRDITLFLLGGVAQIAQEMKRPGVELRVAGAGPAVSLLLAGVAWGLATLSDGHNDALAVMWSWLSWMNLSLALFNLLPGFPMDGGRLLRAAVWKVSGNYQLATRGAAWCGRAIALALMAAGGAIILRIHGLPLGTDPLSGLWLVLIGVYLDRAARQSLKTVRMLEQLRRLSAGDIMRRDVPVVSSHAAVGDFLPEILASVDCEAVFVADYDGSGGSDGDATMVGLVTRGQAIMVPEPDRRRVTAHDLMLATRDMRPASLDDDAASLLQRLEHEGLAALPVVAADEVLGLVGRASLVRLMERRGRV